MVKQSLTYIEIDLVFCSLTYSVAPCQALLGATGDHQCFNTLATCQDRDNFTPTTITLRFAIDTDYLPRSIEAIPSLLDVEITPPKLSIGENLGQRGSLDVVFRDHPYSDTGVGGDPYLSERLYVPYDLGTFWGKFRARQPFVTTRPIRLIRGFLPDEFLNTYPQGTPIGEGVLVDQETRHYLIDHFDGPRPDGTYQIVGKDVLKFADGKRGQAPRVSNGFLQNNETDASTSFELSPAGIGDLEYPASGYVAIGGEEIVSFTRSSDTLTVTRAQFGTIAVAHDAQDRVQLVLVYSGQDPSDIIADLLQTYAEVDSEFIPIDTWHNETADVSTVYSGVVAEPTSVAELVSELIRDAALVMWWDDEQRLVRLQAVRAIPSSADAIDETQILTGSLRTKEQPETRLSQVWTSFAKRNPLGEQDDPSNFRSTAATINLEKQSDYNAPAIRKIYTRWIPVGGRAVAERLNNSFLSRFQDPPRLFQFEVFKGTPIVLGGGYRLSFWSLQEATGARAIVPVQVTRLEPRAGTIGVEAEEMLFVAPEDSLDHLIIFDASVNNINLRTVHDSLYDNVTGDESPPVTVTAIIESNAIIGSNSTSLPALDIGDWPVGFVPSVIVYGRIQGAGGAGSKGSKGIDGGVGGVALYTRHNIDLDGDGEIWGGGGGGGGGGNDEGGGGGGGAGTIPGKAGAGAEGGSDGKPGTSEAGGRGGNGNGDGGIGGFPGQKGNEGVGTNGADGGEAGKAIDGDSFITYSSPSSLLDIRGGQVN